jgi:hypothetical protein
MGREHADSQQYGHSRAPTAYGEALEPVERARPALAPPGHVIYSRGLRVGGKQPPSAKDTLAG